MSSRAGMRKRENRRQEEASAQADRAPSLFRPGENCWRVARAERAALLVDGEEYFHAFAAAAARARDSIIILAWDFNSRTLLRAEATGAGDTRNDAGHTGNDAGHARNDNPRACSRGARDSGADLPARLGDFLNHLARHRRGLEVRILIWDYPMVFGTDREFPSVYGLGWQPHRHVRVRYDNTHPVTGSHHQKIVVIDDAVAFCGGMDLTCKRWDTRAHCPGDARRCNEAAPYPPMHDVMMMVDGRAARALGELARERWRRATGRHLATNARAVDPWPAKVTPDLRDLDVAIARTQPRSDEREAVREIETLYLDMIAAARETIYIENQYFTAHRVGEALAARLAEADGPEVVIVLRLLSHGWLEELTMQNLRKALIARLRQADTHGRLHVCYPYIDGLAEGTCIDVHSKVMVVDDEWLRIGSANVSNRSMGFDTECDLTVQAQGRAEVRAGIRSFRDGLLAEHLGVEPERVAREVGRGRSVGAAIDALRSPGRTLRRLDHEPEASETVMSIAGLADPEQPVELENLVSQFAPRSEVRRRVGDWAKVLALVLLVAGLTALWRLTPLADYLTAERITGWAQAFARERWAPLVVVGAHVVSAAILFPRPLITLFAVVAFGPWLGFAWSMCGILFAAFLTYLAGMRLDRSVVRRLSGRQLERIIQVLRERGIVAMTALRLVPLAPFAVEGVIAGAIRIKLRDFMIGTGLGMLPGTLAATVFGDQLEAGLRDPVQVNYWLIGGVVLALVAASLLVRRWLLTTELRREPRRGQ